MDQTTTTKTKALPADVADRVAKRMRLENATYTPAAATAAIRELATFLTLCARNPGRRFVPSGPVDDAWHAFLMHSKEYRAYCQALDVPAIDHCPPATDYEEQTLRELFPATVHALLAQGYEIEPTLWQAPSTSSCGCGEGQD